MSVSYLSPRVYIEEMASDYLDLRDARRQPSAVTPVQLKRKPPIGSVAKTVTAFIGFTAQASRRAGIEESTDLLNQAILVNNWTEYTQIFGGFVSGAYLPHAVYGYFINGGGPCYIISLRTLRDGENRAAELTIEDFAGDAAERTGLSGLEAIGDVTLIACPDIMTGFDGSTEARERVKTLQLMLINHCELMGFCFALLDCPPGLTPEEVRNWRIEGMDFDNSYAALYYPWIDVIDPSEDGSALVAIPPCGHIAGTYARSDATRGIHKTPAGEALRGVINLEFVLSDSEQDVLNPIGINALRYFNDRGIRVWGAKTMSSDPVWRAVRVRRFMSWIEQCIKDGLDWAVTETIDTSLFAQIERQITEFLTLVWRSGALPGETPEEAFLVRCDEETNPLEGRQMGKITAEVKVMMHDATPRSFRVIINTII